MIKKLRAPMDLCMVSDLREADFSFHRHREHFQCVSHWYRISGGVGIFLPHVFRNIFDSFL